MNKHTVITNNTCYYMAELVHNEKENSDWLYIPWWWEVQRYLKPGSHMPPTYLGQSHQPAWDTIIAYVNIYRRIITCHRHWPPAYLRSWDEFNFAGEPAVVGDCQGWKYFMWTSSADTMNDVTSRFFPQFHIYRWNGWKLRQFNLH